MDRNWESLPSSEHMDDLIHLIAWLESKPNLTGEESDNLDGLRMERDTIWEIAWDLEDELLDSLEWDDEEAAA